MFKNKLLASAFTPAIAPISMAFTVMALSGCVQFIPAQTTPLTNPQTATLLTPQTATNSAAKDAWRAPIYTACDDVNLTLSQAAFNIKTSEDILLRAQEHSGETLAQLCTQGYAHVKAILKGYRQQFKNPDRKKYNADLRYWLANQDNDANGNPPTTSQRDAVMAQRRAMIRDAQESSARADGQARSTPQLAGINRTSWEAIGPNNVGGRVRSLVIHPNNPNKLFAGSASGGVWATDDGGLNWRPTTDSVATLAVGSLTIDPNDGNVLYMGTGERGAGLAGGGIYKTTDGGNTWNFLPSTTTVGTNSSNWFYVNRIAINPQNSNLLLAATTGGSVATSYIERSADGGNTWTKVATLFAYDVRFDPNNPNNAVAGLYNGIVAYTRDGGLTWQQSPKFVTIEATDANARVELAYAQSRANLVYASVDNAKGEIHKSEDGGVTWVLQSVQEHLSDQGDYANTIWVDPTNENNLVFGGLDLFQSKDGGVKAVKVSTWELSVPGATQPHADHHVIVSVPNFSAANPMVYFGNDGGVYRATNIFKVNDSDFGDSTWQNMNNGLAVTQFYGGAGAVSAGGKIIGGTQDNGTIGLTQGTKWDRFAGGDGGFVAVDPISDNIRYGEYVYLSIHRAVGATTRQYICAGITEANTGSQYCGATNPATARANFIAPFILDPNDPVRMLGGADSLWVTNTLKQTARPTWAVIKPPAPTNLANSAFAARNFISAIGVPKGRSSTIYVGHNSGMIFKTTNGLSVTPTWQQITNGGINVDRAVNRITVNQDNPDHIWVAYSGFQPNGLWESRDGGISYQNISNNLPATTIHDIVRHPSKPTWLYAATAIGVFSSEDAGATWSTTSDAPSNVRVRQLFWYDANTLIAATYGRGMYKANTGAAVGPANYQDLWWAGEAESGWGMSVAQRGNVQFNVLYVYDTAGEPQWIVMPGGTWNPTFTTYTGKLYLTKSAPFSSYDNISKPDEVTEVGSAAITYTSASSAQLQYVINGVSGQKNISRQAFGPVDNTPGLNVGDLWWGGEATQNGWGLNISQQSRTLFSVWYTYNQERKPVWYVMPGGTWTGNSYAGALYSFKNSAWLGVPFNPALRQLKSQGTLKFDFSNANAATMTYNIEGITQSKSLTRQFGNP